MKKYILAAAMLAVVGGTMIVFNGNQNEAFDKLNTVANVNGSNNSNVKNITNVRTQGQRTIDITKNVSLEISEGFRLSELSRTESEMLNANQLQITYQVKSNFKKIGQLVLTAREIDNGDVVVYQEMKYKVDKSTTVPMKITVEKADKYSIYEFAEKNVEREHNKTFGIDMSTNVRGLIEFENKKSEQVADLYLSQNYVSKSFVQEYEDGDTSVIRELKEENTTFKVNEIEGGYTIDNDLKLLPEADNSESWFIVSNDELIKSDSVKESYKNSTNHFFIQTSKWQVSNGNYTKLPWSIEPFKEMGYGRNLVALQDEAALEYYSETGDNLFYDLAIVSINNLEIFKGDKNLWETEYTSTWLKDSYGITAPYVDTRHNENIALFLGKAGENLDIDQLKDSPLNYADFLTEQYDNGNVIKTENGYFIADYFSDKANKNTHTSLNHALGEANFLMGLYFNKNENYKNQSYLETALSIYQAVQDTSKSWIKENGDFWYQTNSDGTFFDTDYPVLTLEDITNAVVVLTENNLISQYPALETMMLSKLKFVMGEGYEIPEKTINNLKALGHSEQVEGYTNVLKF